MPRKKNGSEDLKEFEAAIAATLRPRADRLDPAWRSLLAKEVSLNSTLRSEGPPAPSGKMSQCNHPAGHRYICVHCGSEVFDERRAAGWAWPGALVAMTAVAAALLAMVFVERGSQVAAAARPFAEIAQSPNQNKPASGADRATAPGEAAGIVDDQRILKELVELRRPDDRRILSAAGMPRAVKLSSFTDFFSSN
jgi:hypothetical protein